MRFLFSTMFFIAFFSALAQEKVTIHVVDHENNKAITTAIINVYSINPHQLLGTFFTNAQGDVSASIDKLPSLIEVYNMGFDPEYYMIDKQENNITIALTKRYAALNDFVVTGLSKASLPQDASSIYKIISAATIRAQGAITLNDALNNQLNMSVGDDQILGSSIKMQGLGGDKVKLLIDGMPVNGREAGNIDLGQFNLANTDHIEIIQGPMSVVYGADALGGVINIITKDAQKTWQAEANANYESIGKYNFNLSGSKSIKRHSFSIGLGRNYFQGWKYLDTIEPKRNMLFKPKEQYFGNLNYCYSAASGFRIRIATDLLSEKVTNKGSAIINPYYGYATDEYYYNKRAISRLNLDGKLGETGHWQMMYGYSYYHRIRSRYRKDLVTLEQSLTNATGDQDTSRYNEFNLRGAYNNKIKKLDYTVGYDVDLQSGISDKIPGGDRILNDYAAYTVLKYHLLKNLQAQFGLRAAYNTIYKAPLIPSFNLLYKPKHQINLRASYSKGYRAPSLKELYLDFVDQNHDITGNQNLKAEKGDHVQVSASYMLYEKQVNYAQLLITGFYNNIYNSIALVPMDTNVNSLRYTYGNLEHEQNLIGTIELEGQQSNFHYKLGYSYLYTFAQTTYSAFDAQSITATLQYYWKWSKINFSLFDKYNGAQPFLAATIDGSVAYNGKQPSYNMLDFSVQRSFLKKKIEWTVGVKNILNVQTITAEGFTTGGAHSGDGFENFLPRRLFTSVRVNLH